jgi:membrane-bound inhibitor of C-type lysozyme
MHPSTIARHTTATLLACAASAAAFGAPPTFPGLPATEGHAAAYTCAGGATLNVSYWNTANGQSFALVPVKGQPLLFVSTLAASGVRYQADRYTWWTKGPRADLYDVTAGADAPPILGGCVEGH